MKSKFIFILFIFFLLNLVGCSIQKTLNDPDQIQNAYFYFGSGFEGDTVSIFFDENKFTLKVESDFSAGIDLSSSFNCYGGKISLQRNGIVEESEQILTCDKILLKVQANDTQLQENFSIVNGRFVLIDHRGKDKKLIFTQSKKPFSLE